jgi:hypothetical protein
MSGQGTFRSLGPFRIRGDRRCYCLADCFHDAVDLAGKQTGVHREGELFRGPRLGVWESTVSDWAISPCGMLVYGRGVVKASFYSVGTKNRADRVTVMEPRRKEVIDARTL